MPHKPPNIDEDGGSPPTALLPFFIALYSDRQLRFETLSKNPVDCVAAMLLDEEKSPQHSLVLFNCEALIGSLTSSALTVSRVACVAAIAILSQKGRRKGSVTSHCRPCHTRGHPPACPRVTEIHKKKNIV